MPDTVATFKGLWNFQDPAATRKRFEEHLAMLANPSHALQARTQIARTHGLQRNYEEAHAVLDGVEAELQEDQTAARMRYLLERGRTLNSSGEVERAIPMFIEAWDLGRAIGAHGLAVDAAHMVAYATTDDPETKLLWELEAVAHAERTQDPAALAWLGTLYNNIGWSHHQAGRYEDALAIHRKYETWAETHHPNSRTHRIATWSVGKQLRMLKRYDEALGLQRALADTYEKLEEKDGFVQEELGEILLEQGNADSARPYFKRAHEILKEIPWVADDTERIARLEQLADG